MLPIAVDAMGGDNAPKAIVEGAKQAVDELGLPVVLVGQPEAIGDVGGLEIVPASEVIGMRDDPAQGVRRKKDSSLVRAAEAVRDGRAAAMVSAGNTGATMGAALLRMGRLKGVQRPAIATPIPVPGQTPTVLLDAGANAECTPAHLLLDALAPVAAELDPDATGGAMLLGVEGVCIISHGSSSARAIVNAVRVAGEMVDGQLVDRLRGAVAPS